MIAMNAAYSRSVPWKNMSSLKQILEQRGFSLQKQDLPLTVYAVEGDTQFWLIDSAYEFDYMNEEAVLYMLSADKPVLIHVPLMTAYEEYLDTFTRYEGMPIHFLLHDAQDGELFYQNLDHYLEKMKRP